LSFSLKMDIYSLLATRFTWKFVYIIYRRFPTFWYIIHHCPCIFSGRPGQGRVDTASQLLS
jgi:hypothetical protein